MALKPQRKRKCNQRLCKPLTCLEAKKRNSKDGEYSLLIGGRNMSIYCHKMMSNEPKEYLTLPAGDRENYAEIYNKRYFLNLNIKTILFTIFLIKLLYVNLDCLILIHVHMMVDEMTVAIVSLNMVQYQVEPCTSVSELTLKN